MTTPFPIQNLTTLRTQIDAIDEELLTLLNARASLAKAVGVLKTQAGETGPMYRAEREAQVLRNIQTKNKGPLKQEDVTRLFREIMGSCLALEKPLSVAFLGPFGTFSEEAAIAQFGLFASRIPVTSIDAVFKEVEARRTDFGIVPIENSTEGAVGHTLDTLIRTPLKICGETMLRIRQNLLSHEKSLKNITKVYSHNQSLCQCQGWLDEHLPHAERVPTASNAHAAQLSASEPKSAAIAGHLASTCYDLPILVDGIEDESDNTTRFIVIAQKDTAISGKDKTSIVMAAKNQTGALFELLKPFAEAGVSMTRLESRPSGNEVWEYVFFVDVEGHKEEISVKLALADLERRAAWYKVLGSYPVSPL